MYQSILPLFSVMLSPESADIGIATMVSIERPPAKFM